jgi:hypothetical protein
LISVSGLIYLKTMSINMTSSQALYLNMALCSSR